MVICKEILKSPGQSASHFRVNLRLNVNLNVTIIDYCILNAKIECLLLMLPEVSLLFCVEEETQYLIAVKRLADTLKANFYEKLKSSENCSKPSCLPNVS